MLRLELQTLGPLRGASSAPWVLVYLAACIVAAVGMSTMLLTLVALPPWVNAGPLLFLLVLDVALLATLVLPGTQQAIARYVESRARKRFVSEQPG